MRRKKSLFILAGVAVIGLAIFGIYSKIFASKDCRHITDENSCQSRSDCAAIYDNGFKECAAISAQQKEVLSEAKILCDETGGQWTKTKFGDYCDCSLASSPMLFIVNKGCVKK